MMSTFSDRVRELKESAEDELLKIPGVTGVDLGRKTSRGAETDIVCIRVYVGAKRPPNELSGGSVIPTHINDVPTDVVERTFELHADTGLYDPLIGSISIGSCRKVNGRFNVGTLGGCVKDNTSGRIHLLSSFHTLAVDGGWSVGDQIVQPSAIDGGVCPLHVVGRLSRTSLTDRTDCAIAELTGRQLVDAIVSIGPLQGTAQAAARGKVRKRGRTTGLTLGVVDSVDLTIRVSVGSTQRVFKRQIGIAVAAGYSARFGMPGDSGALVVDADDKAVGLYIGGTPDGSYGVANHIKDVLTALDVRLCPGGAPKSKTEKVEKEKPEKWEKVEGKWETKEKGEGKWEKQEKGEAKDKWEKAEGKGELGEKGEITPEEHTKFEIDRWKQLSGKEPGKESEGKLGVDLGPFPPKPSLEDRLEKLEKEISGLRHFIESALRPALDRNALINEPDFDNAAQNKKTKP